jgi:hypothetical protein
LDHPHRARRIPAQAPPRPQGVERNVVITQWDWADPKAYLHDEISTDKRNPNVNANGLIYGSPEESRDYLPVLDPVHNTIAQVKTPYRDPNTPGQPKPLQPSNFWGDEAIWDSHTTVHNPMFDQRGACGTLRASAPRHTESGVLQGGIEPALGEAHVPLDNSGRQLAVYDPATKQTSMIDTCFATHHLLFAEDANNTLWTSSGGGGGVVGWLNTKMWDQTHDAQKSQAGPLWFSTPTATASATPTRRRSRKWSPRPAAKVWASHPRCLPQFRSDEGYAAQRRVLRSRRSAPTG